MARIERAVNYHNREPKLKNAGIWTKDGVKVWENRSGNARMPEDIGKKVRGLLSIPPQNINTEGYGAIDYFKSKDIVEVNFSGKDGKPDEIKILKADVFKIFRGRKKEERAKSTWEQITALIAERGEQPKEIYWEHDVVRNDGAKRKREHIEITFLYTDIEIEIKHITNGGDPVVPRGIGVNADIRDKGVESMVIGRARAYKRMPGGNSGGEDVSKGKGPKNVIFKRA